MYSVNGYLKKNRVENRNILKHNALLVAHWFTQGFGIDYTATFLLTLKLDSLRIIITIAIKRNFKKIQIDVIAA